MALAIYTKDDFLNENWFRDWVNNPDDERLNQLWEGYIESNPHQRESIFEAQEVMLQQFIKPDKDNLLSDFEAEELWQRINQSIAHI